MNQYLCELGIHRIGYGIPRFVREAIPLICRQQLSGVIFFTACKVMSLLPRNQFTSSQTEILGQLNNLAGEK